MDKKDAKLNEVIAILKDIKDKNLYEDLLINHNREEFESKVKEIFKVFAPNSRELLYRSKLELYGNIVKNHETTFNQSIDTYKKVISSSPQELLQRPLHDIIEIIGYYEDKFDIDINIRTLLLANGYSDSEIQELSKIFEDAFPYNSKIIGHILNNTLRILNNTLRNKLFLIESTLVQNGYSLDDIVYI